MGKQVKNGNPANSAAGEISWESNVERENKKGRSKKKGATLHEGVKRLTA